MIHVEKAAIGLPIIAFIGVNLLNRFLCMTTGDDAVGEIDAVTNRGGSKFRGENEAMVDIYGGMFLQAVMGDFIFNDPVRFKITREFKRFPVLVYLALRGLSFLSLFLDLLIADGVLLSPTSFPTRITGVN